MARGVVPRQGVPPVIRVRLVRGVCWFAAPPGNVDASILRVAIAVGPGSLVADVRVRHVDVAVAVDCVLMEVIAIRDVIT